MNIIGEVKIKDGITNFDLANVVETVVSFVIRKEENGEVKYTPYYREYGLIVGIVKYLVEGIEREANDDLLDVYNDNTVVFETVNDFVKNSNDHMAFIAENVAGIVEFEKQRHLNDFADIKERLLKSIVQEQALNDLNIKLAKKQNTLLSQQLKANEFNNKVMEHMKPEEIVEMNRKFASGEYDMNKIAEVVTEKYVNSALHKKNKESVVKAKKDKVVNFSSTEDNGK